MVWDEVDSELCKERDTILNGEYCLKDILGQAEEQLRRLKSTLYHIDRDLEDKDRNLNIDRYNLSLRETYSNINLNCLKISSIDPS